MDIDDVKREYDNLQLLTSDKEQVVYVFPQISEYKHDMNNVTDRGVMLQEIDQRCKTIAKNFTSQSVAPEQKSPQVSHRPVKNKIKKKKKRTMSQSPKRSRSKKSKSVPPRVNSKLFQKIRNKPSGKQVTCGWMKVLSVEDPWKNDVKSHQYIHVQTDDLPLTKTRVKIDLPWENHITKDILVPKNRFKIRNGRVFNNSKSNPRYATFKIGDEGVEMLTKHDDYEAFVSESENSQSGSDMESTADESSELESS